MTKAVFGLATDKAHAEKIVDRLLKEGFVNENISVLLSDTSKGNLNPKKGALETEKHTKAPEGGVAGATAGGILGGSLGLLAGIGALAIPGLGPFIAAGPILAALSGSAVGGSLGLLVGSLIGAGIPEYEAKKYETSLKAGNILISIHTDNYDELTLATDILKEEGAKDISSTSEKTKSY